MLKPNQTLTKELLSSYKPHYVFFDTIKQWPGTDKTITGSFRFVATKGAGLSWKIQYGYTTDTQENIIDFAPKLVRDDLIKMLIPCTKEVLELYLK